MAKLSCSASPYIIQYDSGEKKTPEQQDSNFINYVG